jgi:hypothetical protein
MATIKKLTRGQTWVGLLPLLALVALGLVVLPAGAGYGGATTDAAVTPYEVDLGGQPGDCSATVSTALSGPDLLYPGLPSIPTRATYSFRIVNLAGGENIGDGWYRHVDPGPGGATIEAKPAQNNRRFEFRISGGSVADVIVNGGSDSTHFPYLSALGTRVAGDAGLHAPSRSAGDATNYYSTSHVEFCYSTLASISGSKFHDNDTDGQQDPSFESGEGGWTITAYAGGVAQGSATTIADGSYTINDVQIGLDLTICEGTQAGPTAEFAWAQSLMDPTIYPDWTTGVCTSLGASSEADGHQFSLSGDTTGIDFGNHLEVTLLCDGSATTLGGGGVPESTVVCPAGESASITSSFDVGLSNDGDAWSQFVVFGGDPTGTQVLTQTIIWVEEPAVYDGLVLQVPTTLVRLTPGGILTPAVMCSSVAAGAPTNSAGEPTAIDPDCLDSRTITEGGAVSVGNIQITEHYKFLGDPMKFR